MTTLDDIPDGIARFAVDQSALNAIFALEAQPPLAEVAFSAEYSDLTGQPIFAMIASSGSYRDLVDITFSEVATTGAFYDLSSIPDVLSEGNIGNVATIGDIPTTLSAFTNDSGFINASALTPYVQKTTTVNGHALSGNVTVSASDLSLSTVATSGSYSDLTNKPVPSFSTTTRTVGTAFQISTTRSAQVIYKIPVTSIAALLGGSQAACSLKYADNSAMTTNLVTLPGDQFGVGSGLVVTAYGTLTLSGMIPAGKWVQITTTNVSGTPTYGTVSAQEVLIG